MNKSWYVISGDNEIEPEEYKTKRQALKRATFMYNDGDDNVFIQEFNDTWHNGYFSNSKALFIKDMEEK